MQASFESSRCINKTVSVASLDQLDSRTGSGVDRSFRGAVNRFGDDSRYSVVDNHGNSPALQTNLTSSSVNDSTVDNREHKTRFESLKTKAVSTPAFRSSREVKVTKTSGEVLESELLHLSTFAKIRHFAVSQLDNFKNGRISQSPFVSPLLADDELLRNLCPVHLVVSTKINK